MLGAIELNAQEQSLLDAMELEVRKLPDHIAVQQNAERACELMKHLLARKAIPDQRLRYFTDAAYHVGGRGSSRLEMFKRAGNTEDEVMKHPNFLKYLRYFLTGSSLPPAAIANFKQEVDACGLVTSGDIIPLGRHARQLTRAHGLSPRDACEEFFKLALDCDLSVMVATSIRETVRTTR